MAEAPKIPANPLKLLRKPPLDMSHEERVQFLLQINEDFFQQELAQAVRVFILVPFELPCYSGSSFLELRSHSFLCTGFPAAGTHSTSSS